ncbi:MAG: hypothetical protein B7Z75_03860 [Acidocella sp. 20-57-95]|nr:MAG: hypothetical protein B7Z75_03860 [Acidocella sp. 20-57-95]OYV59272.1 MAG: hypothetical protein B7Z71_08410 [Acidocella sp. 21-58-7]HQT63937.1 energy transducer TonB [Acidocella sp.]HQU03642.1 energy transducer TonB [Acidocella sp.]
MRIKRPAALESQPNVATGLRADQDAKRAVVAPPFQKLRAGLGGVVLHVLPVLAILLALRWDRLPRPPVEPSLELVIDKSPYVGTGPLAIAQPVPQAPITPQPVPKPVPQPTPQPPTPQPPAPPLPKPPPLAEAPALPVPPPPAPAPPHHAVTHAAPRPSVAAPSHLGDNQPAGQGQAYGRMILATPDANLNPKPPYPEAAREHGEQGRVLLSIHVSETGRAVQVDVMSSSGYAILDDAARHAALNWVFNPAMLAGRPVASVILFPIQFQLDAP